ncbi:MAG: PAS domain S-box protein, partial [Halobacteriales archaeon]
QILAFSATVDIIPGQHLFVGRDVTDRRKRLQELRRTKQRLDLALEGSDTGVWDRDLETDEISWDETIHELFGLESGAFEGTFDAFVERIHPDDREMVENAIRTAIEQEERFEAEYRIQRDDGRQIWGRSRGNVVADEGSNRMVGIVTDVTEHKERERELKTLKEQYQTMLNAAPDPILVADSDSGRITEVNEAAETLLGESRENLIGQHQSVLHPSDRPEQYRQLFEEHGEAGGTRRRLPDGSQIFVETSGGERLPVEISVDTVSIQDRSVVFGIFREITE